MAADASMGQTALSPEERRQMIERLSLSLYRFWLDRRGQDLVEYALAAAFVAVTVSAFFPPSLAPSISRVFSKLDGVFSNIP
jgi:Flp pilus assembly pilin Flp